MPLESTGSNAGDWAMKEQKKESLCQTCSNANVSCPVYPLDTQKCVVYVPRWQSIKVGDEMAEKCWPTKKTTSTKLAPSDALNQRPDQ